MTRVISAVEARQRLGQIMNEVQLRNDHYIIERAGRPIVAVVPVEEYEAWVGTRGALFERIDLIRQKNTDAAPEAVETEVNEAVLAVRRRRPAE